MDKEIRDLKQELRSLQKQILIYKQAIEKSKDRCKYIAQQIELLSINQLEIDFDGETDITHS